MHDVKALHTKPAAARNRLFVQFGRLMLKRLWLPRVLYEALPYIYMLCGIGALSSTLYTSDWTWILPWAILVGLICLHAGIALATLRYQFRHHDKACDPKD